MGYHYKLSGEIVIDPPLSNTELKKLEKFNEVGADNRYPRYAADVDVKIVVNEVTVGTLEGSLIRRTGLAIAPAYNDENSARHIMDNLAEIYNAVGKEHRFYSHIYGVGELGDHMRWFIASTPNAEGLPAGPAQEEAKLIWPDGSTDNIEF